MINKRKIKGILALFLLVIPISIIPFILHRFGTPTPS